MEEKCRTVHYFKHLEFNINISHAHGGLLYTDRDNKSESQVPIEKLSTLVHKTPNYVLQERKHYFLVHDPHFYSCLEELPPCPNDQIRAASIDFYTSISNQSNQFTSLIYGGTTSHASNFSNAVYDDMGFCDYTSQESTQPYYTEQVNKDGRLKIKKELPKIAESMNIQPNWCQEEVFNFNS